MIGLHTIGVSDMETRQTILLAILFADKGGKVVIDTRAHCFYRHQTRRADAGVCEPYDKGAPTSGNGVMVAFPVKTNESLTRLLRPRI